MECSPKDGDVGAASSHSGPEQRSEPAPEPQGGSSETCSHRSEISGARGENWVGTREAHRLRAVPDTGPWMGVGRRAAQVQRLDSRPGGADNHHTPASNLASAQLDVAVAAHHGSPDAFEARELSAALHQMEAAVSWVETARQASESASPDASVAPVRSRGRQSSASASVSCISSPRLGSSGELAPSSWTERLASESSDGLEDAARGIVLTQRVPVQCTAQATLPVPPRASHVADLTPAPTRPQTCARVLCALCGREVCAEGQTFCRGCSGRLSLLDSPT